MTQRFRLLSLFVIIRLMDEQVLKKIYTFYEPFKTLKFKKGEILIRADEDPRGIFFLQKGIVKVYAISKKGDELLLNEYKPFSFFPMSWAITNAKNLYFYEAMTPVETGLAPKEQILEFIKINPDVLYDLITRVYRGTEGLLKKMAHLLSGEAYLRLITEILIESKRFGEKDGDKVTLAISEKDIAAQTGMSRETVSREIKILKDKGLVSFNKRLLIVNNISKLESELS